MDTRGKRQSSSLFGGMGFYIALLVCVLAAGVVGYFALLNNDSETSPSTTSTDPAATVGQTEPDDALPVTDTTDTPPTKPVLNYEPVPVQTPTPAVTPTPPVLQENPADSSTPAEMEPEPDTVPVAVEEPIPEEPEPELVQVVQPLAGETIAVFSAEELVYDSTLGDWRTHNGLDIQAETGTPVVAAAAGTVTAVEEDGLLGMSVTIDHGDGCVTTYASLHPEVPVLAGDTVAAGDVIGAVGNTSLSEAGLGAHLHFSVTRDGVAVNPEEYLAGDNMS